MLYVLWTILNVVFLLTFITVCLRLLFGERKKIGILHSLIFAFGIVSFAATPNSEKRGISNPQYISATKSNQISENQIQGFKSITIEDNWATKINLGFTYQSDEGGVSPAGGYVALVGLLGGVNWETKQIELHKTKDKRIIRYTVHGLMHWKLLGMNINSQIKTIVGQVTIP